MHSRRHRYTGPSTADQHKINSLRSQLARAEARKDHHLAKQIGQLIRNLNRY